MAEVVFGFSGMEEEPYALCRYLRAVKFESSKMLERLDNTKEAWLEAKHNNFYPNLEEAMGCPHSVFLTQYPYFTIGRAKNGCPVDYFQAGRIHPEGILCLIPLTKSVCFFWNSSMLGFRSNMEASQKIHPNLVRMESLAIIDLQGLSSSALSKEAMEVVKMAGSVADFFPETLHCMIVINAPKFFAMSWSMIKTMIDPRTAQRIQVFSSASKGLARVAELIEESEIPKEYGGTNTSVEESFLRAQGKTTGRQQVNLLYLKKRGKATHSFSVEQGEALTIRIYTRSASSAKFVLKKEGITQPVGEIHIQGQLTSKEKPNLPICSDLACNLVGPGAFLVEGLDCDDCPKDQSSASRGYFLVEAETRR
jgi:hypothetical protein